VNAWPHDLLRIRPGAGLAFDRAPPDWAREHLARARTVVVRRAQPQGSLLAVGLRGGARSERLAAWVSAGAVEERITPEELASRRAWRDAARRRVPALDALDAVAALVEPLGLAWGPVGGAGFELATGVPCLHAASDLDVLLRAPARLSRAAAWPLLRALAALSVRVDVQVETPRGAVALAELTADVRQVVLRTSDGPRLVADPWEEA
jgi:phosphoribosyl-dephospho-CoA transferase